MSLTLAKQEIRSYYQSNGKCLTSLSDTLLNTIIKMRLAAFSRLHPLSNIQTTISITTTDKVVILPANFLQCRYNEIYKLLLNQSLPYNHPNFNSVFQPERDTYIKIVNNYRTNVGNGLSSYNRSFNNYSNQSVIARNSIPGNNYYGFNVVNSSSNALNAVKSQQEIYPSSNSQFQYNTSEIYVEFGVDYNGQNTIIIPFINDKSIIESNRTSNFTYDGLHQITDEILADEDHDIDYQPAYFTIPLAQRDVFYNYILVQILEAKLREITNREGDKSTNLSSKISAITNELNFFRSRIDKEETETSNKINLGGTI